MVHVVWDKCTFDYGTCERDGTTCDESIHMAAPSTFLNAGFLNPLSNFAPKTYHEATNVCAAEGKVLCGVEQPCMNKGCHYNGHYQWTGEECQAGDAGLPAAC